jgi:hypothetical protein
MFRVINSRGFQMTFKNEFTISVQFGVGNYCERGRLSFEDEAKEDRVESKNAEIAIWDKEGKWFDFGHDQVKGYCDTDEVATWIILCTAATNMEDLKVRATNCDMIKENKQ